MAYIANGRVVNKPNIIQRLIRFITALYTVLIVFFKTLLPSNDISEGSSRSYTGSGKTTGSGGGGGKPRTIGRIAPSCSTGT